MPIDPAPFRAETPGCAEVVHLNNAGAALMPAPVVDAVVGYLDHEARHGGYETADAFAGEIEAVYGSVAELVGAQPDEIAVVENATRAWDMAFYGMRFAAGDRILTTTTEYASNYIAYLQVAERTGAVVEVVPDGEDGAVDMAAMESMIDEKVALIAVNHMPTQSGLVNPAAEVGDLAGRNGVPYLLDACQTVGQMPVDVGTIRCDMLSATSRKFLRGPRGVGFLYVRSGFLEEIDPPFLDLHAATWSAPDRYEIRGDARRFESWESNLAARVGFRVAVEYAMAVGVEDIRDRVFGLAERLRSGLAEVDGVGVHDRGSVKGGIVSFTVEGATPDAVRSAAGEQSINVSVSNPPSARLDLARPVVRASPHYYNTENELEALLDVVRAVATRHT